MSAVIMLKHFQTGHGQCAPVAQCIIRPQGQPLTVNHNVESHTLAKLGDDDLLQLHFLLMMLMSPS